MAYRRVPTRWPREDKEASAARLEERRFTSTQIAALEGEGGPSLPDHVAPAALRAHEFHFVPCPIDGCGYSAHHPIVWAEHCIQGGLVHG